MTSRKQIVNKCHLKIFPAELGRKGWWWWRDAEGCFLKVTEFNILFRLRFFPRLLNFSETGRRNGGDGLLCSDLRGLSKRDQRETRGSHAQVKGNRQPKECVRGRVRQPEKGWGLIRSRAGSQGRGW